MATSSSNETVKMNDHEGFEERLSKAKLEARSELRCEQDWQHFRFHSTFDLSPKAFNDNCQRIDARETSLEEFRARFERPSVPVVIKNTQTEWSAHNEWRPERLCERFGDEHRFKVGEDDEEYSVKLSMADYVRYMRSTLDDSPLYIFDSNYGEDKHKRMLLNDYTIPTYFSDDLFNYASYKRRPPHRWFVMGPPRSGTGIHIDPLGTSAWNALVHGFKRWCLFPNSTPSELVQCPKTDGWRQSGEAIAWFHCVYPKTRLDNSSTTPWPAQFKPIEILQKPGETVFVPYGWWHVVLNLTETVAVTQNFCSIVNFPIVWLRTVKGRPKLSQQWIGALKEKRPEIAALVVNDSGSSSTNGVSQLPEQFSGFRSDTSSASSAASTSSSTTSSSNSSTSSSSESDNDDADSKVAKSAAVAGVNGTAINGTHSTAAAEWSSILQSPDASVASSGSSGVLLTTTTTAKTAVSKTKRKASSFLEALSSKITGRRRKRQRM